jgi:hypothetical protein
VTWQKYSGVRRTKFIPEREENSVVSSSTSVSELRAPPADRNERRLSVHVVDKDRDGSRNREVEVEKVTDRRIAIRNSTPPPRRSETWTEITKDLVCREAIQEMGYEYEETEFFYYIVEYLAYVSPTLLLLSNLSIYPHVTNNALNDIGGRPPPSPTLRPHPRRSQGSRP